jgi:hypothetical protein
MNEEIKNCPVCDSDNVTVITFGGIIYKVQCKKCACISSDQFENPDEAIKKWNTRA